MKHKLGLDLKSIPPVRATINIGALFDIPTGSYQEGFHGESILNGGLPSFEGMVGLGNLGKSTFTWHTLLTANFRMGNLGSILVYDTENTIEQWRIKEYINTVTGDVNNTWLEDGSVSIYGYADYSGDVFFDKIKDYLDNRKQEKNLDVSTPFVDKRSGQKEMMKIKEPSFVFIDSLSRFETKDVLKMQDDNSLGDSGANTMAMRQAAQRSRLVNELPSLCSSTGVYLAMTAHMGEKIELDMYHQSPKQLSELKQGLKIKAPPNFTFLTSVCWHLVGTQKLLNTDKTVLYPLDNNDKSLMNQDLNLVTLRVLRNKSGPSGATIDVILSQKQGILPTLSEFHYLKVNKRFGLPGNDRNYACALYPEVSLQRTTIRKSINEDDKLRRAINICSELLQICQLWAGKFDGHLLCRPEELYEDIKKLGYDWDMILSKTRGWWTVEPNTTGKLFLSTKDLLDMRAGKYHPYWLEDDKKTIKKQYLKELNE